MRLPLAAAAPARPLTRVGLVVLALVLGACAPSGNGPGWSPPAPSAAGAGSAAPGGSAGEPASPAASGPSVIPVVIGQYEKGPARFLFSFLDQAGNRPAGSPDRTAQVQFIAPGDSAPGAAVDSEFVWAIEGSRGEYIAHTEFPVAGAWKAIFITASPTTPKEAIGVGFDVQEQLPTVAIGDKAPSSDTPTAADVGGDLARISTDPKPDPRFYQESAADALAKHQPFVLVFATPAFCQSAQCGPTLERVKQAAAKAPADIAFINVEPYKMQFTEGRLQPVLDANNQLQANEFVDQWGILSEPWIFAVDGTGVVRASFEGIATDKELSDTFAAIAGT